LFAAGAGLALLDAFLRRDPPAAGALRARLALTSAAASAKILRLNADAAALRDLRSAVAEGLGPAAKLLRLWRDLAAHPPRADDRPRRPPLVRPPGQLRRRARALPPACVPAVRPVSAAKRRRQESQESLEVELADLPAAARWREWMLRVGAAIFASARPVAREALGRLVGQDCRFDELIADLMHELRGRPYDLVLVAGGYALRTKTRFAPAIRAAHSGRAGDGVAELTRTETFALTAIAYLQPVTRGEMSELAGREIRNRVFILAKACSIGLRSGE
jgi:chromosome segregation and condensation protein ScpB